MTEEVIKNAITEIEDLGYAVVNEFDRTGKRYGVAEEVMANQPKSTKPSKEEETRTLRLRKLQCPICIADLETTDDSDYWCKVCQHDMGSDHYCVKCGNAIEQAGEDGVKPEHDCETAKPVEPPTQNFLLKVSIGREHRVMEDMRARLASSGESQEVNDHIIALLSPESLSGYIIVEANEKHWVDRLIGNGSHGRHIGRIRGCGRIIGTLSKDEVKEMLKTKDIFDSLAEGYLVEINHGAFRGERARIVKIDSKKDTVTVELFDSAIPMPITLDPRHIRVIDNL